MHRLLRLLLLECPVDQVEAVLRVLAPSSPPAWRPFEGADALRAALGDDLDIIITSEAMASYLAGEHDPLTDNVIPLKPAAAPPPPWREVTPTPHRSPRGPLAVVRTLPAHHQRRGTATDQAWRRRYERLVEMLPDAVYHLQLHPVVTFNFVSPVFATLCGGDAQRLLHDVEAIFSHIHPDDRAAFRDQLFAPRDLEDAPVRLLDHHGDVHQASHTKCLVFNDRGSLIAAEGLLRLADQHGVDLESTASIQEP